MALSLHPRAEACGKVILFGEHAVVYGQPAIAAALPGALLLTATALADPAATMMLKIPAWDLDLSLTADSEHPVVRAVLETLGYCDGPLHGYAIVGDAGLPAGAGLGSSAALCVAVARLVLGPDADAEAVVEASLAGERVFHGAPSGVDSQVAARGGLLRFVRGSEPESLPLGGPLPVVIVDSKQDRSTGALVSAVRARHDRFTMVVRPILDAIGQCGLNATHALADRDLPRLGELMNINHGLLKSLGVSSPILDEMCSTALRVGALGAKLTGAGGGGCIVAIPGPEPTDRDTLLTAFREDGFHPLALDIQP